MSKTIIMVIAHAGFRDEEYEQPAALFRNAGFRVITASSALTPAISKFGKIVPVDVLVSALSAKDADAIVFVGGPGAREYFDLPVAHQLAADFLNSGKLLTAICIAPTILARAGLLCDKKATIFPDGIADLQNGGAQYQKELVVRDGAIITACGPEAAMEFGSVIIDALENWEGTA
jgi:protease I